MSADFLQLGQAIAIRPWESSYDENCQMDGRGANALGERSAAEPSPNLSRENNGRGEDQKPYLTSPMNLNLTLGPRVGLALSRENHGRGADKKCVRDSRNVQIGAR